MNSEKTIYLDYQASTPLDDSVREELCRSYSDHFANPHSSQHYEGWRSHRSIYVAKAQLAGVIGCEGEELYFTSGATESNSLVFLGLAGYLQQKGKTKVLVSAIEHESVLACARFLEEMHNFEVVRIPVDSCGIVDLQSLRELVDDQVGLISVMAVNNEIGTIQPLKEIAEICRTNDILFHSDAAQALPWIDLDVEDIGIDLLSLSAHKAYGPKGVGALYIRSPLQRYVQTVIPGSSQQRGIRPGTLPTQLCIAFGLCAEIVKEKRAEDNKRIVSYRDLFLEQLRESKVAFRIHGDMQKRIPGNLNLRFPGLLSEVLISELPQLAFSRGAACAQEKDIPSHVLQSLGLCSEHIEESIRIGMGRQTTLDEVTRAADLIVECIRRYQPRSSTRFYGNVR